MVEPPDRHGDEPLSTSGDDGGRRFAVVTDRPVEVLNPRRQFLQLNLVWATALLIVASSTAFAATEVSNHRSEQRIAVLVVELNRRYAERKATEARSARATEATYRILEQNRRTHCSEMRAMRGIAADAGAHPKALGEIDKLYAIYHCGTARDPVVEPGWTPPPGWPRLPGAEPLASPAPSPAPSPAYTQ
jgi:hypothetical protein